MNLPDPLWEVDKQHRNQIVLREEQTLFLEGAKTRGLFYLVRGSIELRRYSQSGHEITIHRSVTGETFAEASIFTAKFHCTAVATEQSEVVELQRGEILRKFRTEPAFAQSLAQKFAQDVQFYRRRLEITNIRNARERVYFAICEGMMTGNVIQFSREVSLTHEATYRALALLVLDGKLMKTGRGKYQLAHS